MKRSMYALGAVLMTCLLGAGGLRAQSPGEVQSLDWCAGSRSCLSWPAVADATSYHVYRGEGADLPALAGSTVDSCTLGAFAGTTTGEIVEAVPAAGSVHWFLVTALNASGEGGAGSGAGAARIVDSAGICAPAGGLVINEVDYDQPGTDAGEFVEIYNGGAARDLAGVVLILVNGLNGSEYGRVELSDAGASLPSGGYLVVGSAAVVSALPPGTLSVEFSSSTNNLQNGSPDGVALFDTAGTALIDALSYEGSITAAAFDGIAGTYDLVEGTAATAADSGSIDGAMARLPDGTDSGDADADWRFVDTPSPGAPNPAP